MMQKILFNDRLYYLAPRGRFDCSLVDQDGQQVAYTDYDRVVFVCGRYEDVQAFADYYNIEEVAPL